MSKLTREQVLKLAELSKLTLTENEIISFQKELSDILGYVEQLESVDVSGLRPAYQVSGLQSVYRNDDIKAYEADPAAMVKNAPADEDGYVKVGRMI